MARTKEKKARPQLSELQEDILWELRRYSVDASDPAWCSAADAMMDQGLVDEKDGVYSITGAGQMALKWALDTLLIESVR